MDGWIYSLKFLYVYIVAYFELMKYSSAVVFSIVLYSVLYLIFSLLIVSYLTLCLLILTS